MRKEDIAAIEGYFEYSRLYSEPDAITLYESAQERIKRITRLEKKPPEWFKYYFDRYCTCEFADFHLAAIDRMVKNNRWYEVRAWARSLSKSSLSMMEVIYLSLMGKVKNVLLVSNSYDNAVRLLTPFKQIFENNKRIEADYGTQVFDGHWEDGQFTIRAGCTFRALGAGQNPRGSKNENYRTDLIIIDDIDTDEACRNPERVKITWDWVQDALLNTVDMSRNYRILFNGNIIAKDSIITRAIKQAKHVSIVNIRDEHGKSTWPAKNSEADIDEFLKLLSFASIQKEYYNNPITQGSVFKEMKYGKIPPLHKFKFLVAYADPTTSNKDKKGACTKALVLVGYLNNNYYVIKAKCRRATNDEFIDWFFEFRDFVGERCPVYFYIENNSLQDPFYEQVFMPLIAKKMKTKGSIGITPDREKKADKYTRIEATMEPINREGRLILNEDEKGDPDMKALDEQFVCVEPKLSAPVDGVDATEGAITTICKKFNRNFSTEVKIIPRRTNSKRY